MHLERWGNEYHCVKSQQRQRRQPGVFKSTHDGKQSGYTVAFYSSSRLKGEKRWTEVLLVSFHISLCLSPTWLYPKQYAKIHQHLPSQWCVDLYEEPLMGHMEFNLTYLLMQKHCYSQLTNWSEYWKFPLVHLSLPEYKLKTCFSLINS